MPLTRFEECWPFLTESLPELPLNLNIVALTLWPINCGVLTSLLLPHLSSSPTDSLPSLNLLFHWKTDAQFMQDGQKAVWSIPYVSVAFFPSLKQNFIAIRSSKVSLRPDCIFEIHQLWQSGFSRVCSNCYCSCSFERETIKICQSSHKMYSNNILNFQESTSILNACSKQVWKLIECPSYIRHTSQYLKIRVKQHVQRGIRNNTTSGHSKLFDSAICDALNSCVVNYSDECFVVLRRARTKQHLIVLEALYILFNRPSLCKQNPKHSLNLFVLNLGCFNFFFSYPFVFLSFFIFSPILFNLIFIVLNNVCRLSLDKSQMKGPLRFQ